MLAILLLCLVVALGLLSFGVMVWFVVLGMEEGWGRPTVFTVVLAKKLISVTNYKLVQRNGLCSTAREV